MCDTIYNVYEQNRREYYMTLKDHITTLKNRHRELDAEISRLLSSPSATDSEVNELKRQKLQLRDQISRLESEAA